MIRRLSSLDKIMLMLAIRLRRLPSNMAYKEWLSLGWN